MSASVESRSRAAGTSSRRTRIYIITGAVAFVVIALIDTWLRKGPAVGSPDMRIDPVFRIPAPPRNTPYHPTADLVTTVLAAAAGLTGVGLALHDYIKIKSVLPLFVMISSIAIAVPEVFVDVLGGVYMVDGPHRHVFTILGRDMGVFILAGWFSYGVFPYLIFTILGRNPKTKTIWWLIGLAAVGDVVFEELMLPFGSYHYYGNQPLLLIHLLPWWWIPCNSVGCFLAAALAHRYRHQLSGWRGAAMIVITPISVMGVYGFIAMPSFIAVNGTYPWLLTQVLGLMTIALGVVVFAVILHVVLERRPFDLGYAPGPMTMRGQSPRIARSGRLG